MKMVKTTLRVLRLPLPPGNPNDVRWLVNHISAHLDVIFAEQSEVHPMWLAFNASTRFVITTRFHDKDAAVAAVREFFAKNMIKSVVFVHEAWMLDRTQQGGITPYEMAVIEDGGLKEHPDRREGVVIYAQAGDQMLVAERFILRPEHGKPKLAPLSFQWEEIAGKGEIVGRMTNLLPQTETP